MSAVRQEQMAPGQLSVDVSRFAPEAVLLKGETSALYKRFRRFHRLGTPCLLFVGPYTKQGGLDVAIDAAYPLRERFPDLRLATIPSGAVDHAFLDECEMRALGLGHRGIVEWTVDAGELPFWFASASAVFAPAASGALDAPALAAAAGTPLVEAGSAEALVEACTRLFEA
jgi:glycosyltransferase involved in cell wall biosynthesis